MEDRKLTVRAVERALDILLCFTADSDLGLTEIASKIGLHKSTVHRLLTTLEDRGFVVRNAETENIDLASAFGSYPRICPKATSRRCCYSLQWKDYVIVWARRSAYTYGTAACVFAYKPCRAIRRSAGLRL